MGLWRGRVATALRTQAGEGRERGVVEAGRGVAHVLPGRRPAAQLGAEPQARGMWSHSGRGRRPVIVLAPDPARCTFVLIHCAVTYGLSTSSLPKRWRAYAKDHHAGPGERRYLVSFTIWRTPSLRPRTARDPCNLRFVKPRRRNRSTRAAIASVVLLASAVLLVSVAGLVQPDGVWKRDDRDKLAASSPTNGRVDRVVVISVDGLASYAVTPEAMPELTMLLEEGAGTLNARTIERTITLPNHTSMVTGRPALEALGGHGVDWNEDLVNAVVPGDIDSVFTVLGEKDLESAVFAGKEKFSLWERSWPIDRFVVNTRLDELLRGAIEDLETEDRAFTFIHVANPDAAGHASGWASRDYDLAVAQADTAIGRVIDAIRDTDTVVVVTADHGGIRHTNGHFDFTNPEAYTIPFVVWGITVPHGDLYNLNADYEDPGVDPPTYDDAEPAVRNAAVANLVTDLLELPSVPGSSINTDQDLDW